MVATGICHKRQRMQLAAADSFWGVSARRWRFSRPVNLVKFGRKLSTDNDRLKEMTVCVCVCVYVGRGGKCYVQNGGKLEWMNPFFSLALIHSIRFVSIWYFFTKRNFLKKKKGSLHDLVLCCIRRFYCRIAKRKWQMKRRWIDSSTPPVWWRRFDDAGKDEFATPNWW